MESQTNPAGIFHFFRFFDVLGKDGFIFFQFIPKILSAERFFDIFLEAEYLPQTLFQRASQITSQGHWNKELA
jgi:hypothetical protein